LNEEIQYAREVCTLLLVQLDPGTSRLPEVGIDKYVNRLPMWHCWSASATWVGRCYFQRGHTDF